MFKKLYRENKIQEKFSNDEPILKGFNTLNAIVIVDFLK